MNKLIQYYQLWKNEGVNNLVFRVKYELRRRRGKLVQQFPVSADKIKVTSLDDWRTDAPVFFFDGRDGLLLPREVDPLLKEKVDRLLQGEILLESGTWVKYRDWHTHPISNFVYDKQLHWSCFNTKDTNTGDIRHVWQKARFSFLLDVVRYDYHSGENHGEWVMSQILSWIDENPLNQGPHYCSGSEIALRVLNWIFALHFYKHSLCLTEERWQLIQNSIYRQIERVYGNIEYSRVRLKNNQTILECLSLYITGMLFPFYPTSKRWRVWGKRWLQEEIVTQIYSDGTPSSHSLSQQRQMLQCICWAIRLSELNKEKLDELVYARAHKSLHFLHTCQDVESGELPNYGSNDDTSVFVLSDTAFGDYRPVLNTASLILNQKNLYPYPGASLEDAAWYGYDVRRRERTSHSSQPVAVMETFKKGGYSVCKDENTLTFFTCKVYHDKPVQADNLHLDVWIDGTNVLRDAGTSILSGGKDHEAYYVGTKGHNTVALGSYDQMLMGNEANWWYWVKKKEFTMDEDEEKIVMQGAIHAFSHVGPHIQHRRKVTKWKKQLLWEIEDEMVNKPSALPMIQRWHPSNDALAKLSWKCVNEEGGAVIPVEEEGWYSLPYGGVEQTKDLLFTTSGNKLTTRFEWLTENKAINEAIA